ncbi:MAG: ATP-dependent DNA helicase RecQ [Spirochaetales bacterium]|nr:ATP-dependent DNA helicase RecQ [Spirochaetales bacterium]
MNPHLSLQPSSDPITCAARKYFSISYLYPIQRYAVANILDNINQIVVLPTGSGKSLCFQLPALILPGVTLVILPLLSLMKDQMRRLDERSIGNGCIRGDQTDEERSLLVKQILDGSINIVFITPESLQSEKLSSFFSRVDIRHLVIDEAHCVTEWGDTFRPAYLRIGQFIKNQGPKVVTAFTATASGPVINRIKEALFDGLPVSTLIENPDRPNIHYHVIPVLSKSRVVTKLLETVEHPVIIYTRSRKRTEYYAHLVRRRLDTDHVFFYHAGLYRDERKEVEDWFMQSGDGVLTATSAFGLGIDKPDIRTVIHADIPYSTEAYLQESGRAGRDGKESCALLLYSYEDIHFAYKLSDEIQKARYEKLLSYVRENKRCRREYLLSLLGYELENRCAGCDFCSNRMINEKEGEEKIMSFIRKHKRRVSKRELIQILHGKPSYDVMKNNFDRYGGFGMLDDWQKEDIEEGIDSLLFSRKLVVPQKGFWKYKITTGKNNE